MSIRHPVEVKAVPPDRLWLRYSDGVEGEVDLSHLIGRGIFAPLRDPEKFNKVAIGDFGEVRWPEEENELELCGDALYLKLTGKSIEAVFPYLKAPLQDKGNVMPTPESTMQVRVVRDELLDVEQLLAETNDADKPIFLAGKHYNGILISEDYWRSIQETLYLESIPGMAESIRQGLTTPLEECEGWNPDDMANHDDAASEKGLEKAPGHASAA